MSPLDSLPNWGSVSIRLICKISINYTLHEYVRKQPFIVHFSMDYDAKVKKNLAYMKLAQSKMFIIEESVASCNAFEVVTAAIRHSVFGPGCLDLISKINIAKRPCVTAKCDKLYGMVFKRSYEHFSVLGSRILILPV